MLCWAQPLTDTGNKTTSLLGLRAQGLIDNNQMDPFFLGMSQGLLELQCEVFERQPFRSERFGLLLSLVALSLAPGCQSAREKRKEVHVAHTCVITIEAAWYALMNVPPYSVMGLAIRTEG